MLVESLWGIGDAAQLFLPARPVAGLFLVAFYLLLLLPLLVRSRTAFFALSRRQWLGLVALILAGFFAGQLFPLQLNAVNPLNFAGGPAGDGLWLFPLAFIPLLLAAVSLPPGAALLVGLATGTSMALWTTQQIFDPFYIALFGYVAGMLRRLPLSPRLTYLLRRPLIGGPVAQLLLLWLVAWGSFAYVESARPATEAVGWALAAMNAHALPLLLASVVGGLVAWLMGRFFWTARPDLEVAETAGNLRRRFINGYAILALSAAVALLMIIFAVSLTVSRGLVPVQTAQTVANLSGQNDVSKAALTAAVMITLPLIGLVLLVLSGLGVYLFVSSRSLATSLTDLLVSARRLADGQLDTPVQTGGQDEVAALSDTLDSVRLSMKTQLAELKLLLRTSQAVSASIDIRHGMSGILAAALEGTPAAGARAVVVNPRGRYPLTFQDGELAAAMARFDRPVTGLAQRRPVVILSTPDQMRAALGPIDPAVLPLESLVAIALTSQERFQGVLWVGYTENRRPGEAEIELLRTLAGQAAVMVANARLFANAEGGRRRLAAVLASTADAVIVTDQTERVLLINPAMERAFDLKASEVLGRPVAGVIAAPALRTALLGDRQKEDSRPQNVEITTPDGRTLVAAASTIFNQEGQVLGRVAVLHDISHLKALDELKSDFVATVSHDLRNPLTFMHGYVAMMPMVGDLNAAQQDYLDKILGGIRQMSAMVENLLGLGRLEAGLELVTGEVAAGELLQKVAAELKDPATAQGLKLVVMVDPDLPLVRADEALVHRAVTNLVQNAIRYAPHSGRVLLRATCGQDELVISVHDHGPGIARQDQMRLFEKFYSVENGDARRGKGTGLGLAIVKSVAERHGGRAWCASQVGQGSTFYFSLPRE
jgi:PAS domain S-box-containing protein